MLESTTSYYFVRTVTEVLIIAVVHFLIAYHLTYHVIKHSLHPRKCCYERILVRQIYVDHHVLASSISVSVRPLQMQLSNHWLTLDRFSLMFFSSILICDVELISIVMVAQIDREVIRKRHYLSMDLYSTLNVCICTICIHAFAFTLDRRCSRDLSCTPTHRIGKVLSRGTCARVLRIYIYIYVFFICLFIYSFL